VLYVRRYMLPFVVHLISCAAQLIAPSDTTVSFEFSPPRCFNPWPPRTPVVGGVMSVRYPAEYVSSCILSLPFAHSPVPPLSPPVALALPSICRPHSLLLSRSSSSPSSSPCSLSMVISNRCEDAVLISNRSVHTTFRLV
jgi:hypothetical protein